MTPAAAGGVSIAPPATVVSAVVVLLAVCTGGATAQNARPWSGSGQVSLQHSGGTSTYTSLGLSHDLTYQGHVHAELHTRYGYARSSYETTTYDNGVAHAVTQTDNRRNAVADLLVRVPAAGRVYGTARLLAERDDNQNINRRLHGAVGAGTYLLRRSRQSLQAELSAGHIDERDRRAAALAYYAASALLDHELQFGTHGGSVSTRLEWVHGLSDDAGGLGRARLSLYAPLTQRIGLNVAYALTHDTDPAAGLFNPGADDEIVQVAARTTTNLSVGLQLGW